MAVKPIRAKTGRENNRANSGRAWRNAALEKEFLVNPKNISKTSHRLDHLIG